MKINKHILAWAILALAALGSCGTSSSGPTALQGNNPSGFAVSVLPASFSLGGSAGRVSASLAPAAAQPAGAPVVVNISVDGALGLKSLYLDLTYDPDVYRALDARPTPVMGDSSTLLSLSMPTARGTVEYGQVLIHPAEAAGYSGSGVVAQLRFCRQPELASRSVSNAGPPETAKSQVSNLAFDGTNLTWSYFQQGDFDQNGETNIADLTPLAVHFKQTSPAGAGQPWPLADEPSQVDGDSNGEINAADITAIGQNFKRDTLGGFHIYTSSSASDYPAGSPPVGPNGAGTTELSVTPSIPTVVTAAQNYAQRDTQRLTFLFVVPAPLANANYWVRPADSANVLGIASNMAGGNPAALPALSLDPATPTPPVSGTGTQATPYILADSVNYSFKLLATPGGADVTSDPATVFSVTPAAAGLFTGNVLDISTNYNGDYTVTASYNGVQNSPASNVYCVSGTTPVVVSTAPADGATGVAINAKLTATFNVAMDPLTLNSATFTLTQGVTPVSGAVTCAGLTATFSPDSALAPNLPYTATITMGAKSTVGFALASNYVWNFQTGSTPDTTAPSVLSTLPANGDSGVLTNVTPSATFSEPMDPLTMNSATFTLKQGATPVAGAVSYAGDTTTFAPTTKLLADTVYTATITTGATDLAGNPLASDYVWSFTTALVDLGGAAPFGSFGGGSGMTNQGLLTVVNGDIGTTGVSTMITGFHDSDGDSYTETPLNAGQVNGEIYTAPPAPGTAEQLAIATQGAADAQAAYDMLSPGSMPGGSDPGAGQLGGLTLPPGVYKSAGGTFQITGSDLTLDAQGDPGATWVFQAASALTVGDVAPRSVILLNGAQAKNVYWYVGSAATINGAGGGTMVGTIIASAGVTFSTAGNVTLTILNGRAIGLNASVTLVNTRINVP